MMAGAQVRVERVRSFRADAAQVLLEYYESVGVERRDDEAAMTELLADPRSGMWLACSGDEVAGCVVLKAGVPEPAAGECKRLYVRPLFRRMGLADMLMAALEAFATEAGLLWVYLDTNEAFAASVALYRRRGYQPCPRYNDNPQATLFFRKHL